MTESADPRPFGEFLTAQVQEAAKRAAAKRPESPLADAQAVRAGKEQIEREEAAARVWLERFEGTIPRRYHRAGIDAVLNRNVYRWAQKLVEDPHADSITILGPTGSGKTHEVYGALRHYAVESARRFLKPTIFHCTVADFLDIARGFDHDLRYPDAEKYVRAAMTADVLFFDDLGIASTTDRTETILYRVIDYRWRNVLPMAVTTNLEVDDFKAKIGDRLASRLVGMGKPINLIGEDQRRAKKTG